MTDFRPRRSVLYMPGSNERALEKAKNLSADCLILDLEDAVAPDAKEKARALVVEAVNSNAYGRRELVIRINALSSPWGAADLEAAVAAKPGAILIPKIETLTGLEEVAQAITAYAPASPVNLWAMIETPLAVLNAQTIAGFAGHREAPLKAFVMGTNDLAKETRAALTLERAPMQAWLSHCVLAARAFGIDIIDGVYNELKDDEGFRAQCAQGRALGMDGKTVIHPAQIEPCNDIFSPSEQEIGEARKIMAAFELPENRGKGAISIDGRLVERLHVDMARRILEMRDAIDAAS